MKRRHDELAKLSARVVRRGCWGYWIARSSRAMTTVWFGMFTYVGLGLAGT